MMMDAKPLTFENPMRDIEFVCADCGKLVSMRIPVPASIKKIRFDRCDDCAERIRIERLASDSAAAWKQRAELSGIPLEFIEWDKTKGNVDLMRFICDNREKSMFIIGDNGTGKSRAMAAVAAKMMKKDGSLSVSFWSFPDLLTKYSAMMQESMFDAERFKRSVAAANLVVVDDLGKKKITDSGADLMYWLVNARYESGRRIWVSANLSADRLSRKIPDADIGNAIFDRFRRMIEDGSMSCWNKP